MIVYRNKIENVGAGYSLLKRSSVVNPVYLSQLDIIDFFLRDIILYQFQAHPYNVTMF